MKTLNILSLVLSASLFAFTGCDDEGGPIQEAAENVEETLSPDGPMEEAGEAMDEAAENVRETLSPDGPMEEAGEAMDEAAENAEEAIDEATE